MIIGFSDVITNSSSEVYTIYDEIGCETIKDIVNAILKVGGSDKTFDDLFTIEIDLWDDDESLKEDYPELKDKSHSEIIEFALDHDSNTYEADTIIEDVWINAKDPANKDYATVISKLCDDIFEHRTLYC